MAHILEFANKDKQFSSAEVLENEITHLMARMYDYKEKQVDDADKQIIESWRIDLVMIRRALQNICGV